MRRCICPWSLDSRMHCMQATSGGFTSFRPITEAERSLNPHFPGYDRRECCLSVHGGGAP